MGHTVYSFQLRTLEGEPLRLSDFKGKKILLVNTASECGFTPQYAQLQELHENFGHRVQVIGLPCNDFGHQEPGAASDIRQFCSARFRVTFPLTEKISILGPQCHPLYAFLTDKSKNGVMDSEVRWNFQKYLIDESGELENVFSPAVEPLSDELLKVLS